MIQGSKRTLAFCVELTKYVIWSIPGLQIISRLAPVKLSGETYFCSHISHFWPDEHQLYNMSNPLHMMFKYETSKFSKHLLYISIDLNAGKVWRMVQQNQYHILCLQLLLQFYVLYTISYKVDEIDWSLQSTLQLIFIIIQANWCALQQEPQEQFTDVTQLSSEFYELRVNLKMFHCYTLLTAIGEMIVIDNSLFSI